MGPCAKCIVRAGCTKDCPELKAYINIASQLATFLSVFFTGAVALLIMWLTNFMDNPTDGTRIVVFIVWAICATINVVVNMRNDEKMGELMIILFAPMFTSMFFFIYISSYFVRKSMRQHRVRA